MAPPKRVPDESILEAFHQWKGKLQPAAERLGMDRKNLRDRLRRLGVDLDTYRRTHTYQSSDTYHPPGSAEVGTKIAGDVGRGGAGGVDQERSGGVDQSGNKISRGVYADPGHEPTFTPVPTSSGAVVDEEARVPIKTEPKRDRPTRVRPDVSDRIIKATWRLQAHFGEPTNSELILEQVVEEFLDVFVLSKIDPTGFQAWLRSKLDPAPAPPAVEVRAPAPRKTSKKGGDEGGGR